MDAFEEPPAYVGPPSLGLRLSSPIGLGLWGWRDTLTWGWREERDAPAARAAYAAARARGCSLLDTAEVYGAPTAWGGSERLLGECLRGEAEAGAAPPPVVASKYMPLPWRLRQPKSVVEAARRSAARLGVEAIDLYYVHSPVPSFNGVAALAAGLAAAAGEGVVRAVGVSNYSEAQLRETHRRLAEAGVPLAALQVELSLLHALPLTNGLAAAAAELGVTLVAYSPLAQGRLGGAYSAARPPPRGRRFGAPASWPAVDAVLGALRAAGAAHGGKTPAQVALNWCVCKGAVPIPGARTPAHAEANAGGAGWRLAPDEVAALDAVAVAGRLQLGQCG